MIWSTDPEGEKVYRCIQFLAFDQNMDKKNNRHDLENRQRTYSVFNYSHWLKHWPIRVYEWKFHYENYPRQVPDNLTNRHWLCRQSDSIPSKFILATSMLLTDFGDKNIVDKLWKVVTKLVNYYIISADSPDTRPLDGGTILQKLSLYWLAYRLVKIPNWWHSTHSWIFSHGRFRGSMTH